VCTSHSYDTVEAFKATVSKFGHVIVGVMGACGVEMKKVLISDNSKLVCRKEV